MVRLIITDFESKEENEAFYIKDEFDPIVQLFTYYSSKKYSVYLSKYDVTDKLFSLNIVSKKYLNKNQFLIYMEDERYIILFNHKTIFSAKINENFMADDIAKSILTTKHIAMLSSGGSIKTIYYIINSQYKSALENILKQNTKNENKDIIAKELGDINRLVAPLNELDSTKTYIFKIFYTFSFTVLILWLITFGLNYISKQFFLEESLTSIKRELKINESIERRQMTLLKKAQTKYRKEIECILNRKKKDD